MSVSDSLERTGSQRGLAKQRPALQEEIFQALRATFFSNRPSILPLALRPMAEELVDNYLAFLRGQDEGASARALGRQRAVEGLGDDAIFRMGSVLRRFCHERLDGDGFQNSLERTDTYIEALLKGYLQGRETAILQEQEQVRATLQMVTDRYTVRMKTASAIGQAASSILDLQTLLTTAVDLIRDQFEFYYVGIFLVDESGEWAVLRAGTGEAGEQMLSDGHRLQVGGESMIGQSMANREALIASDVGATPVHFDNPLLPETHSEMALPLISRGQVIGAMTIQSEQRNAFAEEDITVLETMADQLANAILNARLFARMSQTLGETSALYEAVASINTAENYLDLISSLRGHTVVGEADLNVSIVRFDRPWTDEELPEVLTTLARWSQLESSEVREHYSLEQFPSAIELLRADTLVQISDLETDPRLGEAARHLYRDVFHGRSTIFVPLVVSNRWIGYVNAIYSEPRTFADQELNFLTNLASQVAIMVQLLTSLEEARESSALLQTVMSAIPNPIFYKDTEGAYQLVNDAFADQVLGLPRARIEGSTVYDLPEAIPPKLADVYHEADMKLIREPGHQEYEAQVKFADGEFHSVIFNKSTLQDDEGVGAGMVGVILDITERKQAEQEREALVQQLSQQTFQLQTAAQVSRTISAVVELEELLPRTTKLLRERFELYYVGLFLVDEPGQWAELRAGTGEAGRQMLASGHRLRVGGESMVGRSILTQQPQIALDVGEEAVRFDNPYLPATRSEMALPLISRGTVLGALTIQSDEEAAFSEADITVMETIARHLANAILNARLFAQTNRTLAETAALYEAVSSINAANSHIELIAALREHTLLGEADLNISIVRFDRPWSPEAPPEELITLARWTQLQATEVRESYPLTEFPSALELLRPHTPTVITDVESDPRLDDAARHLYRDVFHGGSTLFVPLVAGNRWIGYINAIYSEPRTFEENAVWFLTNLASQAAVMVELLGSLKEARDSSTLIQTVMSAIPNPIFYKDAQGAYQVVNSAFANQVLGLPQDRIEGSTVYDLPEAIPPELADVYHEADMKLIRAGGTQEYEAKVKFADGELHDVLFNKAAMEDTGGAVIGMVGAMLDMTERKRAEQERETLLQQLSHRAVQLQTAAEISQAASSLLDVQQLLDAAVNLVRERFDLYYVGLFLLDDLGEWAVLRAATGEAGRQMLAADHRLRAGGESMIGLCVSTQEPRIALDVGAEAVRFENPYLSATRSEMALPLASRGEVIGAMTIQSEKEAAFSEADVTVMETVARQLANAITNARLFAEAQARLVDLQKLQQQLTGETWMEYRDQHEVVGYQYDLSQLLPLEDTAVSVNARELLRDEIVVEQQEKSSALLAPLTLHEEPIGLLQFEDIEGERAWSEDDLALVEAVREQLALTLENRLLYQQTREALAETNTLYDVGRQISAARTAEEIYAALLEGLRQRPEPDRIVVGLLEPQEQPEVLRVAVSWVRGEGQTEPGSEYPLAYWDTLYEQITERGLVTISDIEASPLLDERQREVYRRLGMRSVAALDLRVRGISNYGVILIYSATPRKFTRDELEFYSTIVRTASVALENQLLLETTQEEAERRAFLNEVMQTASAHLHPEDLMLGVGSLIARHFQMPTILWQWDGQRAKAVALHSAEGNPLFREERLYLRLLEMPGIGGVITAKEPLLWNFENGVYGAPSYKALAQDLELEEVFSAPLLVRDEVLGVMTLGRQAGHPPIDMQEMAALRNAAVNVGVALENARLYQDAQETAEKLKEVDRLKSEFLANMSHELRTPLNSIIGFSRVILKGIDGPLTEMQQTDLEAIHESGKHLLNLINDVLDLSKIEAGKMEFVFEPTDLKKVASGVLSTAIALVKDKSVELQQDMPEDLPIVVADERRIRQVVLNLVGNAAKFTDEGYIRVAGEYDDQEVILSVEDSGVGIPPEKYDEVFAEFRQVDSSSTRRYGGTGLGLPVSKKFVEAHGGRIWFESEVGVGSTFYVALPIAGPPAESEPEEADEEPLDSEGRIILTVDDDEGVITLFRRYLEQEGYQVVGLTRAASVVEEAKRIQPYAITLDILMPDRDGWAVIRDLKADPETRDIPVIVCSIVSDKDKGLSMGVSDYLVKPILEQELLDILARLAEESGPQRVLVVDDSVDDRQLLCRILRSAGYIVEEAIGGAEAIGKIHQSPPDVVILDLMMPEVDGFAVLENLKANEQTRKVPVVVVTAKDLTLTERELLHARAESLLQKGLFDQQQLLGDVTNALQRLSQHPQLLSGGGDILTSF